MGCHISPKDIKDLSLEGIGKLLATNLVSIDWWENIDGATYYLRIRCKDQPIVDAGWGVVFHVYFCLIMVACYHLNIDQKGDEILYLVKK